MNHDKFYSNWIFLTLSMAGLNGKGLSAPPPKVVIGALPSGPRYFQIQINPWVELLFKKYVDGTAMWILGCTSKTGGFTGRPLRKKYQGYLVRKEQLALLH